MTMLSKEAGRVLTSRRQDAIFVSTMTTIPWLRELSPSPLNLSCTPLMGGASALGLGLAIAQPTRKVIILDADGSLLMQLGTLVTISGARPENLYHFIFRNGVWFEGYADFPIPHAAGIDFSGLARAAGYPVTYRIDHLEQLEDEIDGILTGRGPALIDLAITTDGTDRQRWTAQVPQDEVPDTIFNILGDEARILRAALRNESS